MLTDVGSEQELTDAAPGLRLGWEQREDEGGHNMGARVSHLWCAPNS